MKTRTRALTALAALLVAAPALSACGGGDDSGAAADAVEGYFHALGDKDPDAACKLMTTEDGKKPLESDKDKLQECVKTFTLVTDNLKKDDLDTLKGVKVKKATVDGDKATVDPSDVEGLPDDAKGDDDKPAQLVKLDGSWYLNSKEMASSAS